MECPVYIIEAIFDTGELNNNIKIDDVDLSETSKKYDVTLFKFFENKWIENRDEISKLFSEDDIGIMNHTVYLNNTYYEMDTVTYTVEEKKRYIQKFEVKSLWDRCIEYKALKSTIQDMFLFEKSNYRIYKKYTENEYNFIINTMSIIDLVIHTNDAYITRLVIKYIPEEIKKYLTESDNLCDTIAENDKTESTKEILLYIIENSFDTDFDSFDSLTDQIMEIQNEEIQNLVQQVIYLFDNKLDNKLDDSV
jgi:hypothetical protein